LRSARPFWTWSFSLARMGADHIMPNFWVTAADAADVAQNRHGENANYNFADGHAQALKFPATYSPENHIDRWNPSVAP